MHDISSRAALCEKHSASAPLVRGGARSLVAATVTRAVLASSGWTFADIGYRLSRKGTAILLGGYVAGALSEEITYRGFAIRGLQSLRIQMWLAVVIAAIPVVFQHGIKSIDQLWWFFGAAWHWERSSC